MKTVQYLRVSGQGQVNGEGFARQLDTIKTYCDSHNLIVSGTYMDNGVSGTIFDRPELSKALFDLNEGDTFIFENMDRLARSIKVQEQIVDGFNERGITLISAVDGIVKINAEADLQRQIKGVIFEYEKKKIVAKLKHARDKIKLETGKCEGAKSVLETRPELIETVRSLYRKPRNSKRLSSSKIARKLNEMNVVSFSGKQWTRDSVNNIIKKYL